MARGFRTSVKDVLKRASQVQQEQARSGFGNLSYYNLTKGTHTLRFLPPGVNEDSVVIPNVTENIFAFPVYQHKRIPGQEGKDGGIERVRCVAKTWPEKGIACPVCDAVAEYEAWGEKAGLTEDDRKAHGMDGKKGHFLQGQAFCNAINRESNETAQYPYDGKMVTAPLIYIAALHLKGVYNRLILFNADQDKFGDFLDVENGPDTYITVSQKKNGWGMDYQVNLIPKHSALYWKDNKSDDENNFVIDAMLANMNDIGKIFQFPKEAAWDNVMAAAGIIRGLIGGGSSSVRSRGSDDEDRADDRPTAATRSAFQGRKRPPGCFKHHSEDRDHCQICAFEEECTDVTKAFDPSDKQKLAAWNRQEEDPSLKYEGDGEEDSAA